MWPLTDVCLDCDYQTQVYTVRATETLKPLLELQETHQHEPCSVTKPQMTQTATVQHLPALLCLFMMNEGTRRVSKMEEGTLELLFL